jgi:hypothetical protein
MRRSNQNRKGVLTLAHAMDEARGWVEPTKVGHGRAGDGGGAEARGLEEEQRDGREEQ